MSFLSTFSAVGDVLKSSGQYVYASVQKSTSESQLDRLSQHSFDDFAPLLQLNDRLMFELADDFSDEEMKKYELNPPRVIVAGLTSAGKSSLLERVIGYPIFPTRDNVCTRQPFAVRMRNDPNAEHAVLRFMNGSNEGKEFRLPEQIKQVRQAIEAEQGSNSDDVTFENREIHAEISSKHSETFTFTDLPGIFLVSERKMGKDYASSRALNEQLQRHTMEITKKYLSQPNTIVLLVISSTDWMHGMNNDTLIAHLAEWLEEVRKDHDVPVYGVITKLDTQDSLSGNSPLKKVLTGQLPKDHILQGLRVRRWIPVVNSPAVLAESDPEKAASLESSLVLKCLKTSFGGTALPKLTMGRASLITHLKQALLGAIASSHGSLRRRVEELLPAIDKRIANLPHTASKTEKLRMLDSRLQLMDGTLKELIGDGSASRAFDMLSSQSLRMQLLVEAPKQFEAELKSSLLRGELVHEVQHVLNQAALEQGGNFESDLSFVHLSQKIVNRYQGPCLDLVSKCAEIVRSALLKATNQAFGEYKELCKLVIDTLGLSTEDNMPKSSPEQELKAVLAGGATQGVFPILKASATNKVLNLLDAMNTMTCFHPMWRNFDLLYQNVLLKDQKQSLTDKMQAMAMGDQSDSAEDTLKQILRLPELAKFAKQEGELAMRSYQEETKQTISPTHASRISKHFARVEVMGYIVRMTLVSAVYPIVIRDLRDGLFQGLKAGSLLDCPGSVQEMLRMRLMFDSNMEKKVLELMDPSPEDVAARQKLERKRETLISLKKDFSDCTMKLKRLVDLLSSEQASAP